MSIPGILDRWAAGYAADRADRWRRRSAAVAGRLPYWRRPDAARLLVRTYLTSLFLGLLIAVTQVFWRPALVGWVVFTVVMLVSWTMLRTVINVRDAAPEAELDEYEHEVIRTWQAIAYGWLVGLAVTVSVFMILVATFGPADITGWVYTAGLLTVVAVLALSALPTVAYVNTFGPSPPATLP